MTAWILLLLLLAAPAPQDDEVVARIEGREFTADELGDWLVARVGSSHLEQYLFEQMVLVEAAREGALVDEAALDAALAKETAFIIKDLHRNDETRWRLFHEQRGIDLERQQLRRREELRVVLCMDELARRQRQVTEEQVRALYDERYGELQEVIRVEVLFFGFYTGLDPEAPRPPLADLSRRAKERAEAAHRALAGGTPLAVLRGASDPVTHDLVHEGRVDAWRRNLLGEEVDQAVRGLDSPGELAPVVEVWDGYWVVRLVERLPVRFESEREALLGEILSRPVLEDEYALVREQLTARYAPERLLR